MARGTEKGMIIYRDTVEIKGLSKPFEKECRLYKEDGKFSITYPERELFGGDIVQTKMVYAYRLSEVEKKYEEMVEIFTKTSVKKFYTTEIRFQMGERTHVYGTTICFNLDWGVYRRFDREQGEGGPYWVLERSFDETCKYNPSGNNVHRWNSIPWTPEAEAFFRALSSNVVALQQNLVEFLSKPFDLSKAGKLLNMK